MIISWYGEGSFRFQNGETSLICDIPTSSSGASIPRGKVNIYLQTITKWDGEDPQIDTPLEVNTHIYGGGEYDSDGIRIKGFQLENESESSMFKTVYQITWDDIVIGLLGHISQPLPPTIQEHMNEVDVLIAPGGGEPFLEQTQAIKLIKQLNPKIFIPSFVPFKGLKRKTQDPQPIYTAFDAAPENQDKFTFKKKDLVDIKKTQVVTLNV